MTSFIIGWFALILGLVAVAYFCDRLHIGQPGAAPPPPPVPPAPSPEDVQLALKFGEKVMIPCVLANYSDCALAMPRSLPAHLPPNGQSPVIYHPKYERWCLCYIFYRAAEITGPISKGLHTRYLPYSIKEMSQKLNLSLSNFAIAEGFGPCQIIDGKSLSAGRVCFVVAFQ